MDVFFWVVGLITVVAVVLYLVSKGPKEKERKQREAAKTRVRTAQQRLCAVRKSSRPLSARRRAQVNRLERGFDTDLDLIDLLVLEALLDEFDVCSNECGEDGWYEPVQSDDAGSDDVVVIEDAVVAADGNDPVQDGYLDSPVDVTSPDSEPTVADDAPAPIESAVSFDAFQGDEPSSPPAPLDSPNRTPAYEPPVSSYEPSGGGDYSSGGGSSSDSGSSFD